MFSYLFSLSCLDFAFLKEQSFTFLRQSKFSSAWLSFQFWSVYEDAFLAEKTHTEAWNHV